MVNTTVFFHAGHLFALQEDGLPYELDSDNTRAGGGADYHFRILRFFTEEARCSSKLL